MNRRIIIILSTAVTYFGMITVNALANILPINNITTGDLSDSYQNLFTPAGITFSIWGLIYLLLAVYIAFQIIARKNIKRQIFDDKVNGYFILTSLINILWIFAWHYRFVLISVLLMVGLLVSLIRIADLIRAQKLTFGEKLLIKVPFGVYFGWITIATIANIVTLLVSLGWNGFGISDVIWMVVVLVVGVIISGWRMVKDNSIAYGLVPVWAYYGIFLKHTSEVGFNSQYPLVITVVLFCLAILMLTNSYLVLSKRAL